MTTTTEYHDATEYDVVQRRRFWWYYSDDYGRRFFGPTRSIARFRALRANKRTGDTA